MYLLVIPMSSYLIHLYHRLTHSKLLLSYTYGIYAEFALFNFILNLHMCLYLNIYNIPEKAQWNMQDRFI